MEVVQGHIVVVVADVVVVVAVVVVVVVHEAAVAVFVVAGDDNFAEFGSGDIADVAAVVVDDIVAVVHEVILVVMVVDEVVVDADRGDQHMCALVYVGSSTSLHEEGREGKNTSWVDKVVTYKHGVVNDMHLQHMDVEVIDCVIKDVVVLLHRGVTSDQVLEALPSHEVL